MDNGTGINQDLERSKSAIAGKPVCRRDAAISDILQLARNEVQRVLLMESPSNWGWNTLNRVESATMAILTDLLSESTDRDQRIWDLRHSFVRSATEETRQFFPLHSRTGEGFQI